MVGLEVAPRARRIRFWTACGMIVAVSLSCIATRGHAKAPVAGELDDSKPAAAVELHEGLAISTARARRAAVDIDPIAAQVLTGKWAMPRPGDSVTFPGGQAKKWEPVKTGADGWFSGGALRGGYLATSFAAQEASVMMLEAAGHGMVYVDGEPRAGDLYSTGYVRLPVRVRKGPNALLFQVGRGRLKAKLTKPTAVAFFSTADMTIPDLIGGESVQSESAILVVNASENSREDLVIGARLAGGQEIRTAVPALVPLSIRKVAFELRGTAPSTGETAVIELKLEQKTRSGDRSAWETLDSTKINLRVCQSGQTYTRTFRSSIDGSLQYYSVVPALPGPSQERPGIILTLHGAGVEGIGQAKCYSRKPGLYVVAPTNRRPYGFDWEDWGRLDAIEVLEHAARTFQTGPQRTYLTGHSMGGHGTWHLGVTFPDRFAAIAPSAGWISMWSYAGAKRTTSASPIEELMARALGPSDTLALSRNLARLGVYILHGDADDNVPVGQARQMRHALSEFHPDFAYHEQPGAGHWWGNPCVDWPPLIAFLADHKIPAPDQVRKIDFVTASPAVSSRAHWLSIESQLKSPSIGGSEVPPKMSHGWHSIWDALCRMPRMPGLSRSSSMDRSCRRFLKALRGPMAIIRSGWFVLAVRGRSVIHRRLHRERARPARALSRKHFATGSSSSTEQKGHQKRTHGRSPAPGSTRRCSGTGVTARSTLSRTRASSSQAGNQSFAIATSFFTVTPRTMRPGLFCWEQARCKCVVAR
jgi:pimeloyl-ACP methyl ester carboxylesterase